MKTKTTAKNIKGYFKNVICIGYCDLSYLMRNNSPSFYTCGVYGWNADVYVIDYDTVIVMGYRPFGNIKPNYKTVQEYEQKAREAVKQFEFKDYDKEREIINNLVADFVKTVLHK